MNVAALEVDSEGRRRPRARCRRKCLASCCLAITSVCILLRHLQAGGEAPDALLGILAARGRLRQYLAEDAVVDLVLMFTAPRRYEVAAEFGEGAGLSRRKWAVHAWPDRDGRWHLLAAAARPLGGNRSIGAAPGNTVSLALHHPSRSVTLLLNDHEDIMLMLRPHRGVDSNDASLMLAFCEGVSPRTMDIADMVLMLARMWECADDLGTHINASAAQLFQEFPCDDLAQRCSSVWSYSRASSNRRLPCWDDAMLSISVRFALEGDALVARSAKNSVDFLWKFVEGEAPRALQEHPAECEVHVSHEEVPDPEADFVNPESDHTAGFAADGSLYATGNASHILLFDTTAWELRLVIVVDEQPLAADAAREGAELLGLEVWSSARVR